MVGLGGLVCTNTSFGSSKGSQCSIGPDSSTLITSFSRTCCASCLKAQCLLQPGRGNTCLCLQTKKARVDDLISKLALQSCQNTVIGSPLERGVSGGEVSL